MNEPRQRVVLITGASSGIGQACASYLGQRGYRVYGTSRRVQSQAMGASTAEPVHSGPFAMIQMDVDDDSSVQRGVDFILEEEGRLDVVVNNAGFGIAGSVEDTSIDEAKAQFETNFFGAVRVCRAAIPVMRQQRSGYIVNVSSMAGMVGVPFQAFYSASKFALEGMTESLRMEMWPFGIRVVLIEPGNFRTQLTAHRRKTLQAQSNSVYLEKFVKALGVMETAEMNGPSPDKIAYLLERIITDPSPRLRYMVGAASERIGVMLKKVMPASLFEWFLMKYYGLL